MRILRRGLRRSSRTQAEGRAGRCCSRLEDCCPAVSAGSGLTRGSAQRHRLRWMEEHRVGRRHREVVASCVAAASERRAPVSRPPFGSARPRRSGRRRCFICRPLATEGCCRVAGCNSRVMAVSDGSSGEATLSLFVFPLLSPDFMAFSLSVETSQC